jgi:EEF1A N-terminal glycine/lysine methyltransferase
VVLTDYPDQALVENMAYNVAQNVEPEARRDGTGTVSVMGYVWGQPVEPLLALLEDGDGEGVGSGGGFDLIILSDLIFNHTQVRTLALHLPL